MRANSQKDPQTAIDALRDVDPDRRRAAVFAEADIRDALLTLYAFHYELAKIPELVSEPMIGAIRYQWWRDAVAEIYEGGQVRKHEVATPLSQILRESAVSRYEVDQLIDARERDLEREVFRDLDAAETYAEETSGRLMLIAARLCEPTLTERYSDAIKGAGAAWGLMGMARSWQYYHTGMLKALEFKDIVNAATRYYHGSRALYLQTSDDRQRRLPSELMPAMGYAALVPGFARRMFRHNFDPLVHDAGYSPLSKQIRLMRVVLSGKL